MINKNKNLLIQIELLRKKMTYVAMNKGFTDMESVQLSQELDKLLNRYQNSKSNQCKS